MKSIRSHLFVLLLSALGVLCCVGGWGSCYIVRKVILQEFDYSLKTKAHDLFMLTELEGDKYEFEFSDMGIPEFERIEHPEYYQIRLPNGDVLRQSPSLNTEPLAFSEEHLSAVPRVYDLTLPGGLPGRAAVMKAPPLRGEDGKDIEVSSIHAEDSIIVVLARDTVRLNQVFRRLMIGFTVGTLLVLLIMVLAIRWVVSSGLRPLDQLARQTVEIQPDALDVRFPLTAMPVELHPIANQLNDLLERMELAFQRERYLTASMAHELYTPIAELRSMSEVTLKWPENQVSLIAFATDAHAIALQMQSVVDALLSLSRCESGLQDIQIESVDVVKVLDTLRSSAAGKIQAKEIELTWSMNSVQHVETDPVMLSSTLGNLFKNAVEYTPSQGMIHCQLNSTSEGCELILTNTNASLVVEDLEHMLEPLWRKDASRTGTSHSGLGLAVADRFSRLLGIHLTVSLPTLVSFQVRVLIPPTI